MDRRVVGRMLPMSGVKNYDSFDAKKNCRITTASRMHEEKRGGGGENLKRKRVGEGGDEKRERIKEVFSFTDGGGRYTIFAVSSSRPKEKVGWMVAGF